MKSTKTGQGKKLLLRLDSAVPSWGEYCGCVVAEDDPFGEFQTKYQDAARGAASGHVTYLAV